MILRLGAFGTVGITFSLIGSVSLLVAVHVAHDLWQARQAWSRADGIVVENDLRCRKGCSYRPVVEFRAADGGTYAVTGVVGSASPAFAVGQTVPILYPPDDPRQARIDAWRESGFGIALPAGFFLVFGGLGCTFLVLARRRLAGARWAREFGTPVQADVVGVERDGTVKVNGRAPFRIVSQWQNPRDRAVYRFVSEPMWVDPSRWLAGRAQIPVKVDPDRPKHRYWMDVAFLPEAT